MKLLNEANLAYYSTCDSQSTKEGWLYKKGEVNKSFQKRWFVLKGNLLFYFDKSGDRQPNGVIILEGYTVELVDAAVDGYTFQIGFKGASNTRKYILQAESHEVMEQWMKAITCASYDYMKLMVAELKSQLDELTAQELAGELATCKTRSENVDQFGHQPFAQPAKVTVQETHDTRSDVAFEAIDQAAKSRLNPFDRGGMDSLDPFGQTPFHLQAAAEEPTKPSLQVPPQAPSRKKKSSPKLLRKITSSPKLSRRADDSSARSKTQFFNPEILGTERPLLAIKTSRFLEMHSLYGEVIRNVLGQSVFPADTSATLIDL